jgi:hypothetical protein
MEVSAKNGVATDVTIVEADPTQFGSELAGLMKLWRFQPDWQGRFEVKFQFIVDAQKWTCVAIRNPTVSVRVPTEIHVSVPQFRICDQTQEVVETELVTRTLEGIIRCDCPERRPIPGALIHVTPEPAQIPDEDRRRVARTASDGSFRVDGLPDGKYHVDVAAKGFLSKGFIFRVQRDRPERRPVGWLLGEERALEPVPVTAVREADIPVYPMAALTSGTEGVVNLRVSVSRNNIVDVHAESGSPLLAKAAADNVRTWVLQNTSVSLLNVTFTYRLIPGDCSSDQQPRVTMRFPAEVELTAKRIVKCTF